MYCMVKTHSNSCVQHCFASASSLVWYLLPRPAPLLPEFVFIYVCTRSPNHTFVIGWATPTSQSFVRWSIPKCMLNLLHYGIAPQDFPALSQVVLTLADRIYPESQSSFRAERRTIDMIVSPRQLQERNREQNKAPLCSLRWAHKGFWLCQ